RHGETAWSRERRFAGSRDVALEPEGLRQCEAVARALASQGVAAVYASPLERARASPAPTAKPHRLPAETDPAFGAMAFPGRAGAVEATPPGITGIESVPGWATGPRMNTLADLEAAAP